MASPTLLIATFAGGCFWCMEPPFRELKGVQDIQSGYMGGSKANPTYEEVSSGETGHLEVIQMKYDPAVVSYDKLLDTFWRNIDPTDGDGQFADRGSQYHTAIFYHSDEQKKLAEASMKKLSEGEVYKGRKILTKILKAAPFYKAEDYHQDYATKNPLRYNAYKVGSGRAGFLEKTWKKDKGAK
jgi:methionine-S-sulfoxide reductase